MSDLSPRELDVILRSDLGYFAERCFYDLNPQAAFLTNLHIEVIAATSTGGVLTGRGADLILIDDPLKPEEALSEARRNATNDWYANTLYSRLNDKRRGAIVIIMQRLHEDDLVGHVLG